MAAFRTWKFRSRAWALLPFITALLYSWPTAIYIWSVFRGEAQSGGNIFGLFLVLLPALIVLYGITRAWKDQADANTIIESWKE